MEQFNLKWHTYNEHLRELMQHLLQSNESTDITLVCEDKTKLKAHKFVLNACSPVFQSIINDLPQKDPVIYLRGVLSSEMKSIMQFMYLGQATFYQDRMNDFLNVAKSLEIKEISKNVDSNVDDSIQDQEYDEKINNGNSLEEKTIVNPSNVEAEMEQLSSKLNIHMNEAGQYPCEKCDKYYTYKCDLKKHIQSAHEGIKFPCNNCGYKATHKQALLRHIKSIHEGIKFPCDLCGYKATRKDHLYAHEKNKH